MKTFEKQFADYKIKTVMNSSINNTISNTKEQINKWIDTTKITKDLANIFWLNKEQINKLTQNNIIELWDNMEVNQTEAQLAKMFGKYDELLALNNTNNPIKSYAWII